MVRSASSATVSGVSPPTSRRMAARQAPVEVHLLSSATGEGLDALLDAVAGVLYGAEARPHARKRVGKPRARKATAP